MNEPNAQLYFSYWGKARPRQEDLAPYHLLAFHSLDVAACGQILLTLPGFSLAPMAGDMGWPLSLLERVCVAFLALHDLGKFARAFQNLAVDLSRDLVPSDLSKSYTQRHDTLGWLLWSSHLADKFPGAHCTNSDEEFWEILMRASAGHHGKPPRECSAGGLLKLRVEDFFLPEDVVTAQKFASDIAALLLPDQIPLTCGTLRKILRKHSWRLAGLAVLADWLGSNSNHFPYQTKPQTLQDYWTKVACPKAEDAIRTSGLQAQEVSVWKGARSLFPDFPELTSLQQYAATVEIVSEPQLFLLEDVTGAGKTEAALILAHRLMAAGRATGLYFALPTMATANQMYGRVGRIYRRLYEAQASPSLILSHGARQLVDDFRQSILQPEEQARDQNYRPDEPSASAQCSAWLADNRKKALLADVGVGTVDQALLGVLPVRHQSLRLLGLSSKVLVVDEVHAYDAYMVTLLERLLEAHAQQGGSAILLSATVPAAMRVKLIAAFQKGRGGATLAASEDLRYPLATQAAKTAGVRTEACGTRPQLMRKVQIASLHQEQEVVDLIVRVAAAGHSFCWIRNTVEDARRAYDALLSWLPSESLRLFHSRFAMGNRLDIEDEVIHSFGAPSTAAARRGQVLIATQVVEQSLDLDFDGMASDLAPIDLLIQRVGRLQRHARHADGERAQNGMEGRDSPVLHLLCPPWTDKPADDWYAQLFPKARYVYPDAGQLWLTQRALEEAGCIVSPGELGERGGVRTLVESVYGVDAFPVPDGLQRSMREQQGKDLADTSLAKFNSLQLSRGYCDDESSKWYEEGNIPTRLGDESRTIYLAREEGGALQPLLDAEAFAWEQSSVRVDARQLGGLAPEWEARFGGSIDALRGQVRLLEGEAFILPLVREGDKWSGSCEKNGAVQKVTYDHRLGLEIRHAG
jgi:CRISPR-associated endonuclease/helicase Cas3